MCFRSKTLSRSVVRNTSLSYSIPPHEFRNLCGQRALPHNTRVGTLLTPTLMLTDPSYWTSPYQGSAVTPEDRREDDRKVSELSPAKKQSTRKNHLFLPTRQLEASFADSGLQAIREALDEIVRIGSFRCGDNCIKRAYHTTNKRTKGTIRQRTRRER